MNKDAIDKKTRQNLKSAFDDSVAAIDAETASKLTQARYQAIARLDKKSRHWLLIPTGAIATVALAVMVFVMVPQTKLENEVEAVDMDLISSSDELELYEELEFYEWLEDYELPT